MTWRNHLETKAGTACPGPSKTRARGAMQQAKEVVGPLFLRKTTL